MANHKLLGRKVTLDPKNEWSPMWKEWTEFFGEEDGLVDSATVEAVHRDNQSTFQNPYYVLVRSNKGATREFSMMHLVLFPEEKS